MIGTVVTVFSLLLFHIGSIGLNLYLAAYVRVSHFKLSVPSKMCLCGSRLL